MIAEIVFYGITSGAECQVASCLTFPVNIYDESKIIHISYHRSNEAF